MAPLLADNFFGVTSSFPSDPLTTLGPKKPGQVTNAQAASIMLPECEIALRCYKDSDRSLPESELSEHWSGMCAGYVTGIFFAGGLSGKYFCAPENATNLVALELVISYLQRQQQRLALPFPTLALEAMQDAWPCK
jgi:hypothetical protein